METKKTKISIGSDHAAFALRKQLISALTELGYNIQDFGPATDDSVDYPDYAKLVCRDIQNNESELGILICGSGIGMSISANKYTGIRAGLCTSVYHAVMTRKHNNANILCLGARVTHFEDAFEIAKSFLSTEFEGGRHQRRIDKIERNISKEQIKSN